MDILIKAVKMILSPFIWACCAIGIGFGKFGERWENSEEVEDKIAIGVLYTLFLIALGFIPMIPCIFIKSVILLVISIVITFLTLFFAIAIGWMWLVDFCV